VREPVDEPGRGPTAPTGEDPAGADGRTVVGFGLIFGTKPTEHISAQQIEMFKRAEEIVAGSWPSDLEILLSFRARDRVRELAISYL
jgi:hypothetical protein